MKRTDVIILGGGQAGLATSRCLTELAIDHVVLERGRVAERWRSERWDSLRLLTPNWQSRLPGWSYRGPYPDGFMTRDEVIDYLERYARSFGAPLASGRTVTSVERNPAGFLVSTDGEAWIAPNVVIATGHCDQPFVPPIATGLPGHVAQIVPSRYRKPDQLASGGALVVGASATGLQLAAEIHASGRPVTLAVGRHTRLPRTYRGRDILGWLDALGILDESFEAVPDLASARRQPSLQLVGSAERRSLDLGVLQNAGVRLVGRVVAAEHGRVFLADDLADHIAAADARLARQLERIDRYIDRAGLSGTLPAAEPLRTIRIPGVPRSLELAGQGIRTVVWATGYRRSYPWLRLPVLDERGEIQHTGGITQLPGLYAIGLQFLRRRKSSFLGGVGADAHELTQHMVHRLDERRRAVA